jgi:hypothetical protein
VLMDKIYADCPEAMRTAKWLSVNWNRSHPLAHWTKGTWESLGNAWNEVTEHAARHQETARRFGARVCGKYAKMKFLYFRYAGLCGSCIRLHQRPHRAET